MMKGLRESLSGLLGDVVAATQTRIELFGLELAEEKNRLVSLAGLVFAAFVFLVLALLVFSLLIAALFWDTEHRYLAIGLLAVAYALIGVGLLLAVRRRIESGPPPFAHTLDELRRDAAALAVVRHDDSATDASGRTAQEDDL